MKTTLNCRLENCPFCGEEPYALVEIEKSLTDDSFKLSCIVGCVKCAHVDSTITVKTGGVDFDTVHMTMLRAINKWNHRKE